MQPATYWSKGCITVTWLENIKRNKESEPLRYIVLTFVIVSWVNFKEQPPTQYQFFLTKACHKFQDIQNSQTFVEVWLLWIMMIVLSVLEICTIAWLLTIEDCMLYTTNRKTINSTAGPNRHVYSPWLTLDGAGQVTMYIIRNILSVNPASAQPILMERMHLVLPIDKSRFRSFALTIEFENCFPAHKCFAFNISLSTQWCASKISDSSRV